MPEASTPPTAVTLHAVYPNATQWEQTGPLAGNDITCEFRVFGFVGEADAGVPYATATQDGPIILTFVNVRGKKPRLKGNGGEADLIKPVDEPDRLVLMEINHKGDPFVYTISKRRRMAIWTKAYFNVFDSPWGHASVGKCY